MRVLPPTLFTALAGADLRSAAICGDQHLVRIMGAQEAGLAWPPNGVLPHGTPICHAGYVTNAAVRPLLLAAATDAGFAFVFGHLNETDSTGHRFGPASEAAQRAYTAADALVGELVERLQPGWERTLLIVLSDHGMETVQERPTIDLLAESAVAGLCHEALSDGSVALVRLRDGVTPAQFGAAVTAVAGVCGWQPVRPGVVLVAGEYGVRFASAPAKVLAGIHGGPGSTATVAVVGGGHPAVAPIAAAIAVRPPHLADWAPTIAAVLGAPFPGADGRNLAG